MKPIDCELLAFRIGALIADAEKLGIVFTVERMPVPPLAMGNAHNLIQFRPIRGEEKQRVAARLPPTGQTSPTTWRGWSMLSFCAYKAESILRCKYGLLTAVNSSATIEPTNNPEPKP